jgi:putative CocE/NonD family hydrolase
VLVERDIPIPLEDGVVLRADHWMPERADGPLPTVLIRTPYARGGFWAWVCRSYAERGFQTLIVSSRGTFGSSGGPFQAMRYEHDDGLAVIAWMRRQPWYGGRIVLAGVSYVGYTQWAVAADAPDDVVAMSPHITSSRLVRTFMVTGTPQLDIALRWSVLMATQERRGAGLRAALRIGERKILAAMGSLPLTDADRNVLGVTWPFFQDVARHPFEDPMWSPWDYSEAASRVTIPASLFANWYDPFLIDQIADYTALQDAGREARLTVGPWTHESAAALGASIRETILWSELHTADVPSPPERGRVRLFVMGEGRWRDFDAWPPRGFVPVRWHLHGGGRLRHELPEQTRPSRYRYDPADPTPTVGGRLLSVGAGRKDNRRLESRPDVLTFTSEVLDEDLDVIGEISAEIWMTSSRPNADVFVRVCEVDERGRSWNVTDGLANVRAHDGDDLGVPRRVRVVLAPTAQRFARGHRIRIQISGGSHPMFARNSGAPGNVGTATELFAADQVIYHDPEHPSAVLLPEPARAAG